MKTYYSCSYRNGHNEVRLRLAYRMGCPWPCLVFRRVHYTRVGTEFESFTIGLN